MSRPNLRVLHEDSKKIPIQPSRFALSWGNGEEIVAVVLPPPCYRACVAALFATRRLFHNLFQRGNNKKAKPISQIDLLTAVSETEYFFLPCLSEAFFLRRNRPQSSITLLRFFFFTF